MNQSAEQLIVNQSTHQSTNQPINRSIEQTDKKGAWNFPRKLPKPVSKAKKAVAVPLDFPMAVLQIDAPAIRILQGFTLRMTFFSSFPQMTYVMPNKHA